MDVESHVDSSSSRWGGLTCPPSMTVEVSFSLAVALLRTISSTEFLVTSRITFTGLSKKHVYSTLPKGIAEYKVSCY